MQQTRVKPMVEGGVLSAIAIVFALISAYLPIIGPLLNLIWPVPIILLGVRHGYKWSIMATAVAGVIIALLLHPLHAVSVVVGFGLIGIALGYAIRARFSPAKTIIWGSIASLISKVAIIGITIVVMGINPLNFQAEAMTNAIDQALGIYRSLGIKEEELANMAAQMKAMIGLMGVILPVGFAGAAVIDTSLNYWVAKAVLRRMGVYLDPFPPFKEWRMPRAAAYAYIAALTGVYFGKAEDIILLYNVSVNVQMAVSIMVLIQGMALFYFLADKYNLSKLVRNVILFVIFTNQFFTQIVIFAGIFDLIIDYRKLREPR
jgi:uncharacterized protein YybS (DUF2232 family)